MSEFKIMIYFLFCQGMLWFSESINFMIENSIFLNNTSVDGIFDLALLIFFSIFRFNPYLLFL
jgi:hypothetical protein